MLKINAFRIDISKIEKVNHYSFQGEFKDDAEMFSFAWRNGGVFRDEYFLTILDYNEIPDKDRFKFEWVKDSPFLSEDLNTETRKDLLHRYISFIFKEKGILKNLKNNIKQSLLKRGIKEEIGKFIWDVEVLDDVIFNGEFYYVLNFKIRVFFKQNLWEYVGRDPERLNTLKGRGFRFEPNPKYIYYIEEVYKKEEDFKEILDYLSSKYKEYMQNVKIDKNQPIIRGSRYHQKYRYLPQLCYLSPKIEEFDGLERMEFRKLWILTNQDRFEIIRSAFKNSTRKSPDILEVNSETYPKPKILVNGKILGEGFRPYDVPKFLQGRELDTYILIDKYLGYDPVKDFVEDFLKTFNSVPQIPNLKVVKKIEFDPEKIMDIDKETKTSDPLAFSLILFRIKYPETYEKIKRLLFKKNIISQALIYSNIKEDNREIILKNILVQSMSKLGIKVFTLKSEILYDYIIGVDVGRSWRGNLGVGGCSVVITGDGIVKRIVPISQPTTGDTLKISWFLESIHVKDGLSDKSVLVLRDGNLRKEELDDLYQFVKDYEVKDLTYMNVVKRHRIFMVSENNGEGVVFGDGSGLLLPHGKDYKEIGPKPIRIKDKYVFDKSGYERVKVSHEDLKVLNDLTYLVFSMLPLKKTKLPAPIDLADKFVKALAKDWKIEEKLLEEGLLYFL